MYAEMTASLIRGALAASTLSAAERAQAEGDLQIILEAQRERPELDFALTQLADQALHSVLGEPMMANVVEAMHGAGARQIHDADAWATPAYDAAWTNTRAAFAAAGIHLDADPAAGRQDGRAGALCIRSIAHVN